MKKYFLLLFVSVWTYSGPLLAAVPSVTLQGYIADSSDVALSDTNVQFVIKIYSGGSENCLMYQESITQDLTNGFFSLSLNTGTRNDSYSYSFADVFSNRTAFTLLSSDCTIPDAGLNTVYTPSASAQRKLVLSFKAPSTMSSFESLSATNITAVPYAVEALAVGGYPGTSLCRVENAGTPTSISALSNTQWTEFLALVNGTSSKYTSSTTANGAQLPTYAGNPSTPSTGSIWYDTSSGGSLKYYDGSAVKTVGTSSITDSQITYTSKTANTFLAAPNGSAGSPSFRTIASADLPSAVVLNGGQTGALTLGTSNATALTLNTNASARMTVLSTGSVGIGTTDPKSALHVNGTLIVGDGNETCNSTRPGALRYIQASDDWQYCDGTSWRPFDSAGCGGPASCTTIGSTCSDGSIFIGCHPPDFKRVYITKCDAPRTWDSGTSSCTGARGTYAFNAANASGKTDTGARDFYSGEANTNLIVTVDANSVVAGFQTHIAAQYCYDLNMHSKTDWYLPSFGEVLYLQSTYSSFTDLTNGATGYVASNENGASGAASFSFVMGATYPGGSFTNKETSKWVRCFRRDD
ncbi:MAG: hypothetical protein ACOYOK_14835 [Pseudobdellovibrionaceae bacterium]